MKSESKSAGRRTLLQRGLALLGGGVAVAAGARWNRAEAAGASHVLTLYARKRPLAAAHGNDTRLVSSGELLDAPAGSVVGAFHTNCFCVATPFGTHPDTASNLEFHVLNLRDGTLFGISSGATDTGIKAHAIVGGTDRYAGARGNYVERSGTTEVHHGVVEFVVTLA